MITFIDRYFEGKMMLKDIVTHPWLRYLARNIDFTVYTLAILLFIVVARFILGFLGMDISFLGDIPGILLAVLYVGLLISMEVFALHHYSTTPGKYFLNIRLQKSDNNYISYNDALMRTIKVWLKGLGMGIPFVNIITQINAYTDLQEKGMTSWDKEGEFSINFGELETWWIAVAIFIVAIVHVWYFALIFL